jgi:hypothetical protein
LTLRTMVLGDVVDEQHVGAVFPDDREYGLGARASCWIKQRRQKAIRKEARLRS